MTHEPVLAHVSRRLGRGAEDLATEALVHILRSKDGRAALAHLLAELAPDLAPIARLETQAFDAEDGALPDIAGEAADGRQVLLVEVKLNAGLTLNQPVTYIRRLHALAGSTALLFLIPRRRIDSVWADIRHRCAANEIALDPVSARHAGDAGPTRVALVTWEDVLDRLEAASSNSAVTSDIGQLRGLYESHEVVANETIDPDFLAGATGAQLRTVAALLSEALDGLVAEGLAEKRGPWAAGPRWFGKSFETAGWGLHLNINLRRWGLLRPTPLWLRIYSSKAGPLLRDLEDTDPPRLLRDAGDLVVPVDLTAGADRDELRRMIDVQLREVVELLRAHPRDELDIVEELGSGEP